MSITIKDIAKIAGVSAVTVSRALNNKPDISSKTKNLILKIAEELEYKPNGLAKSLVTRKTKTLGVLIPNTTDAFFSEVIQGIADECLKFGYSLVLSHTNGSADDELQYLRLLQEKRVEGLFVYPVQEDNRYIDEFKKIKIPFVFLNRHTPAIECDYVANDNQKGAYLAVEHLIQKGHKQIVYMCNKPNSSSGIERIAGCKKAMSDNGLALENLKIIVCDSTMDSCYKITKQIFENKKHLSAIFCWDDKLAIGAMKAVHEKGLKMPQDIALIGYNDIEISKYLFPPLTTIRQATFKIGTTASKILLERLETGKSLNYKQIIFEPKLIARETT